MTTNFILTGAPGAGKTSILRQLEVDGVNVVEEAATDVIALEQAGGCAEPWTEHWFSERIVRLQQIRQARAPAGELTVFDRSPVCTLALAEYLGHPVPTAVIEAVEGVVQRGFYSRQVGLVQLLGFITHTEARRISYEDSQRFEAFHVRAYERFGFELVPIPPGSIVERAAQVLEIARR